MITYYDWIKTEGLIEKGTIRLNKYGTIISKIINEFEIEIDYKKGRTFYRARIFDMSQKFNLYDGFQGYNAEQSLAPKSRDVKSMGRFNLKRRPVLYIAEDEYTALAELRSGKARFISIAEVELLKDVRLADFTYRKMPNGKNDLEQIFSHMTTSCSIVVNSEIEKYRVTNFIGEKLKDLGYEGLKYSSSLSASGDNIVLFNPENALANNSKLYLIPAVLYYADEQLTHDKLLPKSITDEFLPKEIEYFFDRISKKTQQNR